MNKSAGAQPTGAKHTVARLRAIWAAVAVTTVLFDQASKWLVLRTIGPDEQVKVLGPVVLRRAYNTGIAFTLGSRRQWLPYLLPAVVVVLTVWSVRRLSTRGWRGSKLVAAVLGLVVGGAWGNLLDRCFRGPTFLKGAVVDFIDAGLFDFPVFNVADSALVIGCILLVLWTMRDERGSTTANTSPRVDRITNGDSWVTSSDDPEQPRTFP